MLHARARIVQNAHALCGAFIFPIVILRVILRAQSAQEMKTCRVLLLCNILTVNSIIIPLIITNYFMILGELEKKKCIKTQILRIYYNKLIDMSIYN